MSEINLTFSTDVVEAGPVAVANAEIATTTVATVGQTTNQSANTMTVNQTANQSIRQTLTDISTPQSPEDLQRLAYYAERIDLHDGSSILNYGVSAQKKFKNFTHDALELALGNDLSEIGAALTKMAADIKNFAVNSVAKPRLFQSKSSRLEKVRRYYQATQNALDQSAKTLTGHRLKLCVDDKTLDQLYRQLMDYHHDLEICVLAGRQKLSSVCSGELNDLYDQASTVQTETAALAYRDLRDRCDRFEKRLQDLELTKTAVLQTAVQVQLSQQVNQRLVLQIQESIEMAIPLWQQNITAALTTDDCEETFASSNEALLATIGDILIAQQTECERRIKATMALRESIH